MEDFSMNITKEYFEKQLKKHDKITVYSPENIPLDIFKELYIGCDGAGFEFEMDYKDLADYCNAIGLKINN
jgi:hypothetical protein